MYGESLFFKRHFAWWKRRRIGPEPDTNVFRVAYALQVLLEGTSLSIRTEDMPFSLESYEGLETGTKRIFMIFRKTAELIHCLARRGLLTFGSGGRL